VTDERSPDRPLVVARVAELLAAGEDAAQKTVRRVLRRERDTAEHLQRVLRHLARGA
jgi:hypothetical protein